VSCPLLDASRKEPVFEAPGSTLEFNPDGYMEVELASGRTLRVQAVEEVPLLRLDEFVATGNADVFQQCLSLLGASALDRERLQRRAGEQSLARALDAVERTARKIEQELVDRALPAQERRRPRGAQEAALLRPRGTPERLIGPSRLD